MSVYLILASIPGRFFIVPMHCTYFSNGIFQLSIWIFNDPILSLFFAAKKGQNWKKSGFCANLGRNCWNYVRFIIRNAKC